ncbi:doublesex cognate 73A [Arctopsyche grandis]|uniref:doublesex cognate 73A n=1 Tax=Arctopsyche grandis TaxID=121162 RepID=UPI00406D8371
MATRESRPHPFLAAATTLLLAHLILAHEHQPRQPLIGHVHEVFHKNSISQLNQPQFQIHEQAQPRRNSKSMSFMDYYFPSFPSSRTPKVSNVFNDTKTNITEPKIETQESTTPQVSISTLEEGRATKKGTSTTKRKTSARLPSSTTPKIKNATQKVTSPRPTQKITTSTKLASNTQKTTHKHYTIYPSVVMSKTNPPTTAYKSKPTESTTKTTGASSSTTAAIKKQTLVDLASVSESVTERSTTSEGTSPMETAATDIDGREGELDLKPQTHHVKINEQTKKETVPLPAGSTSVLAKPTKYHYYPHNQHIYLLPECAIQQVCNAVYVRLNYTQPLCACPARHRDPCSASLNADDMHTTQLTTDSKKKYAHKAVTLVKTCEATSEMRECRAPRDWSLLALQNVRTGKSHYLVICRCPEEFILEGPMSHDQPTYASVPGIRVYGMMCVQSLRHQSSTTAYNSPTSRPVTTGYKLGYSQPTYNQEQSQTRYPGYSGSNTHYNRMARTIRDTRRRHMSIQMPPIPWEKVKEVVNTADWEN